MKRLKRKDHYGGGRHWSANRRLRLIALLLLTTYYLLLTSPPVHAEPDYVEVLTGAGSGRLNPPQPYYRDVHFQAAFGHDLKPWLRGHLHWSPPGDWSYRVEPFVNYVSSPHANVEVGCTGALRIGWHATDRLMPYLKGGIGPIYSSQHVNEQATKLNVVSYAAVGLQYRLNERGALSVEGWRRHYSNGSLRSPNSGVDTVDWLVGYQIDLD